MIQFFCLLVILFQLSHAKIHPIEQNLDPQSKNQCDLIVFSYDRPMQLFAFLESFEKLARNVRKIGVLCRITPPFEKGYEIVRQRFPYVYFKQQSNAHPKSDFKPYLMEMLLGNFGEGADHVVFAVDDIVITDELDFKEGMFKLHETGAYGLYYRLGKHVDYCYMQRMYQGVPPLLAVGDGYYTWEINSAKGDWGYPNTLDLTLYEKQSIQDEIVNANFTYPNEFEGHWPAFGSKIGLCFERAKMVNVFINTVTEFRGRDHGRYSVDRLNNLFLKGKKINVDSFYRIINESPHIETELKLISR